jgi:hypothetical protein
MKYELTKQQLEEMVLCIVHNHLNEDEAMEYALSVCGEFASEEAEVVWPNESRIDAIGQNGGDGEHYHKVTYVGLYD